MLKGGRTDLFIPTVSQKKNDNDAKLFLVPAVVK